MMARLRRSGLATAVSLVLSLPLAARAETSVPSPGASSRIDSIRLRGSLRVAVLDEYPWLKQNPSGSDRPFQGPAWRLAEEYARRLGVRLETVAVVFDNKVSVLSNDRVDITIAPLLATPERAKAVDLIVYSRSAQCLFGLADNPKLARADGIDDLNRPDITVAYTIGTPQGDWIVNRLPKAMPHGVKGTLAAVQVDEILSHRDDVATIDKFFFAGLEKRVPGLASVPQGDACLKSEELPIPIGMAIAKGQPVFLAWLRSVAATIRPQTDAEEMTVETAGY